MHEAAYYEVMTKDRIHCELCPHQCIIEVGHAGKCRVRVNDNGQLIAKTYGFVTSAAFDPIEKKPLYHFKPGSTIFSIGSAGCNFKCGFCQNAEIALKSPQGEYYSNEKLIEMMQQNPDNIGIAFTYNEPSINYEFMLDMAKRVKALGMSTVCVSNGFIMPDPLDELLKYIDAFNIDLKAFSDRFYHKVCGGERAPVMETIRRIANTVHVEVSLLLIEGENDAVEELEALSMWLKDVSPDVVLHINRYYPAHHYDKPPTSLDTLLKAEAIAKKHLKYVYLGNVPEIDRNTYCPNCGAKVIERNGSQVNILMNKHACHACNKLLSVKL